MNVETRFTGAVDSIDLDGAEPVLVIGTQRVPVSGVKSIGGSGA